jgi:hypothetical protein
MAQITNPIVAENLLPGNPPSQWQITDAGDATIQGYATDISVTNGGTIYFKINTPANAYTIRIYRLGYYQGNGARLVATVFPSVPLPQSQPAPITDSATGLIDCGNWSVSASWRVPTNATSGVYIAKLIRTDTGGASHIAFIVRNDTITSDVLFKTSDMTWQAYNAYGGNSLYVGGPVGRAYKVSYNRPFVTASPTAGGTSGNTEHDWLFNAEYPMIRWLEANGYNVSYTTGLDADRQPGSLMLQHRLITSLGHDEYWSGLQRTNVETALAAGVNLAFFSGNEVGWKVRWEPSADGSNTPYRTMVCYKESLADAKIDPSPTWTGYWRDPRFSPPADGGRPENRLTGTLSVVNDNGTSYTMQVPAQYAANRFWRNTTIASLPAGGIGNLGGQTLGYEWDVAPDNGFRPPGLMCLSSTVVTNVPVLQGDDLDYESLTATHNLTLYRAASGALVFGAGTCQWSWGLDTNHYDSYGSPPPPTSLAMQQATVNLFADMGIQPATLQAGLVSAAASTDQTPPTVTLGSPATGGTISLGTTTVITGTASDVGGQVAAVEVSADGGTTWHPAVGMTNWSYTWISQHAGSAAIMCRAIDDSGNLSSPISGPNFTVVGSVGTLWPSTAVPNNLDEGPDSPVELGVKFRTDVPGHVTGIRFYKASANAGTHIGNLWTSSGAKLASATFTGESATGWQQVNFSTPVAITSNIIYVASYHVPAGHYSEDDGYFQPGGVDNPPLHAPSSTEAGMAGGLGVGNDVYAYGANGTFPTNVWDAGNYWVDVVFVPNVAPVLPTQNNRFVNELTTLIVTNTASDTNTPAKALSYMLLVTNADSGMAVTNAMIETNGVITWTPAQTQSPGTNQFTTMVTDGSLSATNSFNVVVTEVNQSPVLPAQGSRILSGTQSLTVTNTASEPNIHSLTAGYGLVSGPVGLSVDTNGVIRWMPAVNQVPSTNTVTTVATNFNSYDMIHPQLAATNSFTVTVQAIHNGPILGSLPDISVNELTLLTVTNTATDNDLPALSLGYTLLVTNVVNQTSVTNAMISNNGIIFWAPAQNQSPGTNQFTTIVTDGSLSATNRFNVVVLEVNQAPMLTNQANLASSGLTAVLVTNTATEPNIHSMTTSYTLVSSPPGARIDTNGVITWVPTINQVPSTNTVTTVVTNANPYDAVNPHLTATNRFVVTINAVHNGPVLPTQTNISVNELTQLVVTNTSMDNDIPSLPLNYVLLVTNVVNNGTVTNAIIDTNGVIVWTPSQIESPSTNQFTTIVTDGSLSATNNFIVVVNEVNTAPVLMPQNSMTLTGLESLAVTNTASEPNIHSVTTGYDLVAGPAGAGIDVNGVITWTPVASQVPSTNVFTTVATNTNPYDAVDPSLTATNSFVVTVNAIHNGPALSAQGNQTIDASNSLIITNTATDHDLPVSTLTYLLAVAPAGANIDTNGIITWTPVSGQGGTTNLFITIVTDSGIPPLSSTNLFEVVVNPAPVIPPPIIQSIKLSDGVVTVVWSSVSNAIYQLQYCGTACGTNWCNIIPNVRATGLVATATNVVSSAMQQYYRVMVVPSP